MKKILLTAIVAMFGMSAFAAKPAAGTKGYFYNAAAAKFIGTDAKLGAKGQQFEVYYKSPNDDADPTATFQGTADITGAFFIRFKVDGSNYLTFREKPISFTPNYGQLIVKETAKGWLITHPYPNSNGPTWMHKDDAPDPDFYGTFLQVVDGELTVAALDEANEGAYWKFVDQDEYDKLTATSELEPEPEPAVFPEEGAKGFLYNIDSKLFISKADDNTATLAAKPNAADELMVVRLAKDKDNTPSIEGALFMRFGFGSSSNLLNFNGASGLICNGSSYGQWIVKETENGILLTHPYPNSSGPAWMKTDDATIEAYTGSYLAVVDGALAFVKFDGEPTANAYWKFGSEEDITTRISSVENVATTKAIFNIAGQQIKSLQKGLNIVNGKKIYVK